MFRTLYSRLSVALFVLLCLVGITLILLIRDSSQMYQQEVMQKINSQLARHIVLGETLIRERQIDNQALSILFHQLMIVNPAIELYLLDPEGTILGFNAPESKVKRTSVSLKPISSYLDPDVVFPIMGDDPRNVDNQKVFSAAKIENQNGLQGYLYIVLGGEKHDQAMLLLRDSYILDSVLIVVLAALAATLLGGLIVFAILTRRLRMLGSVVRRYADTGGAGSEPIAYQSNRKKPDEIDELGLQFNTMAVKIQDQIQKLRRMDGLRREMVANISHDLRTPLTTMRGYLETLLLKGDELSADDRLQYLRTALSYGRRLGELVEELFELARLDSCESVVYAEPFSMGELVQDVAQSYQLRARQKKVWLHTTLNSNVPMVYGDIAMMQRVLENLLENGLRHTPPGGQIDIHVDIDSSNVIVRVTDTGCGIPAEDVAHIFERFYQPVKSKPDKSHAGLGLAIVKRILDLHDSAIEVRSNNHQGTTFSFQVKSAPTHQYQLADMPLM